MNKLMSAVRGSSRLQALLVVGLLFLISFVTFNVLFSAATEIEYFKEVLAALIGTLLTVVITTLLLREQTGSEELKETNVEVFKRKIEAYDGFLAISLDHLSDWKLTDSETREIRKKIYQLSLFSSEKTIDTVVEFLRHNALREQEEGTSLQDVISAFREDLNLSRVGELATTNLEAVERLLRAGDLSIEPTRERLQAVEEALLSEWENRAETDEFARSVEVTFEPSFGAGDGLSFAMTLPSKAAYIVSVEYVTEHDGGEWVHVQPFFDELTPVESQKAQSVCVEHGFHVDEEKELQTWLDPDAQANSVDEEGLTTLTKQAFIEAVLDVEKRLGANVKGRRPRGKA